MLGRDGQVVWVTDADGEDALEVGSVAADGAPQAPRRRRRGGAIGQVPSLAAAPDGSKVAVAARDGHLRVVEVASGAVTELAASDNGEVTGLAWSADSAWLAWSHPDSPPLRRLRLARVADGAGQVTDVTDGRFTDTEPVFTIDGKYLAFLSKRSFDPVYDAHFFDLSFPFGARPYLMPLAAATLSPFGPQPGGRSIGDPDDESDDSAGSGDGGSDSAAVARGMGTRRRRTARRKAAARAARPRPRWPSTSPAWPTGSPRCRCPSPGTPRCARSRAAWPGCASR